MRKPQIILASLCLLAGMGATLAFKAKIATGFIIVNGARVAITTNHLCLPYMTGCLYLVPNEGLYQIFTTTTFNGPAVPLGEEY